MSNINILPNGLQVNVVRADELDLDSGRYISSEFILNKDDKHLENLQKVLNGTYFKFFKRGLHQAALISNDTSIIFRIYSKLPKGSRFSLVPSSTGSFAFYQDIVDMRYDGDPKPTYEIVKDNMTFTLPEEVSLDEPQDLCYNYPEAVLWDILEFITVLASSVLVNGFEEGIVVGPLIVEID